LPAQCSDSSLKAVSDPFLDPLKYEQAGKELADSKKIQGSIALEYGSSEG